jgi:hypothetical protein
MFELSRRCRRITLDPGPLIGHFSWTFSGLKLQPQLKPEKILRRPWPAELASGRPRCNPKRVPPVVGVL